MSQEGTCAGGVVGWPLGRSPQRHWGARGGCSGGPPPRWCPQPLTSVGTFCWAPGEGSPRPEWGMGGRRALAPLKALPREVRAETEGLGPVSCWAGGRRPPLPSESGQCQSGDWRGGGRCQDSPEPQEEGASGAPGSVLVGRLGSLGAEGT